MIQHTYKFMFPKLCSVYTSTLQAVSTEYKYTHEQSMSPHFGANSIVKLSVSIKTPNKTLINTHPSINMHRIASISIQCMTVCTIKPEDEAEVCKVMHQLNCTGIIGDLGVNSLPLPYCCWHDLLPYACYFYTYTPQRVSYLEDSKDLSLH